MRRLFLFMIGFLLISVQLVLAAPFSDVPSDHPNYAAINYLQENGVIQGYEDNTFRPQQTVNRAEALKILLLGSDIFVPEIQAQEIFPDVIYDAWYAKYALKAKNLSIVKGDDLTGLFRPGDTVNLAEALKMLLKTNEIEAYVPTSNPYSDVSSGAWFAPYFEYARLAGLLDQSANENVYPATPVTRGLLAELMYRLSTTDFLMADGEASYYGEKFHGKTTASGEIFDASAYTAAHLTYPFGTRLRVTNVANGKSVVVRINDRGPYVDDPNRIIDLSKASFEHIAPLSRGIISVKIEVTQDPITSPPESSLDDLVKGDLLNSAKTSCPEVDSLDFIPAYTFNNLTLDRDIPNRVLLDEVLTLTGTTPSNASQVSAFILDENDHQTAFRGDVETDRFEIHVRFPKAGVFRIGIVPGESGQSIIKEIRVQKNTCIEEVESQSMAMVSGVTIDMQEGDTVIAWDKGAYNLFKVTLAQEGLHKSYFLYDLNKWTPIYKEFEAFKTGNVDLTVRGATLKTKSLLEPVQLIWTAPTKKTFIGSTHFEYLINEQEVDLKTLTKNAILKENIEATFSPKVPVRSTAAVILPSGKVHDLTLTSQLLTPTINEFDVEVFPASSVGTLAARYQAQVTGIHFLEVNNAQGLAVINVPIYIRNQFPLIPSLRDLSDQLSMDLGTNLTQLRSTFLSLVNQDRSDHQLPALTLDNSLSSLAQYRSDDMVANQYFGHWDLLGQDANVLRSNYGIQTLVGENLAQDINLDLVENGLMRSAIHRSNILSDKWTRVGFGISRSADGSYIFVQIFSSDPLNMDDLPGLRNSVLTTINDERSTALNLQDSLNTLAQSWSQQMADQDFFDFTDGSGVTLIDTIRDAGINDALGTYIMGNNSIADALDQLRSNTQLQETKWVNLGVGLVQDNVGIIKITLIYTE